MNLIARVAVLAVALSTPLISASEIFDQLKAAPAGWSFSRYANPADILKLRISVKQQNVPALEQMVIDISTPGHPSYGNHMSTQQIIQIIKPQQESTDAVLEWLESYNVTDIKDDGNWVSFLIDAATANEMLDTQFSWFSHPSSGKQSLRTLEYSVPKEIARHIDFVQPTTKFSTIKSLGSEIYSNDASSKAKAMAAYAEYAANLPTSGSGSTVAPPDAVCNTVITPQCLLKLYNVHYAANPQNGAKVSFGSFLTQYARYSDLNLFEKTQALYAKGQSFNVISFNGGLNDQTGTEDATEANLDCQYIVGVGFPVPVTEFSTAGLGPQILDANEPTIGDNEPYMEFLAEILALPDNALPQTLSISYGEDEQSWPEAAARSVCNGFMQLGARGVSVMFSSGDSGPGGICENLNNQTAFVPAFPVSCPFVTGVGGTRGVPETTVSFSGGGFSNYFPQPAYQSQLVDIWLANNPTFSQYYNISGRGYPDVAAQGLDFLVVDGGVTEPVSGTSASSPTFGAIVGLLNSARIQSGQKPLGFLNPFLYSIGLTGLNDITTGSSSGCQAAGPDGGHVIVGAGFAATCGWDPATGLGTPDFGKLLALVAPQECNIGGVLNNPTASACNTAANSALSKSLVASKKFCPITGTGKTPSSTPTSTVMTTTTKAPSCNQDNCYRALQHYQQTSVSTFCSAYLHTATVAAPSSIATCGSSRLSSACKCIATSSA